MIAQGLALFETNWARQPHTFKSIIRTLKKGGGDVNGKGRPSWSICDITRDRRQPDYLPETGR